MSWEPVEVRELKEGRYMNIDGEPCQINSISNSKPGKHGEAKARIEAIGIFDGSKRSVVYPVKHKVQVPIIDKRQAQVITLMGVEVQLMDLATYETFNIKAGQTAQGTGEQGSAGAGTPGLDRHDVLPADSGWCGCGTKPVSRSLTVPGVVQCFASTNSNIVKTGTGTVILSGGMGGSALNTLNITGGKVSVQGGTWNVPLATDGYFFRVAGGATYEQTGGTMNAPYYAVLSANAASALISTGIFRGGTFNEPGQFMVGRNNSAVMTVSGGALLSPLYLRLGEQPTYTTTCNLDGGTIACNYVSTRGTNTDHTSILNLNGGTLQARRNDSFFIGGSATAFLTQVNVKSGAPCV